MDKFLEGCGDCDVAWPPWYALHCAANLVNERKRWDTANVVTEDKRLAFRQVDVYVDEFDSACKLKIKHPHRSLNTAADRTIIRKELDKRGLVQQAVFSGSQCSNIGRGWDDVLIRSGTSGLASDGCDQPCYAQKAREQERSAFNST